MFRKSLVGTISIIVALLLCSCEDKQAREQISEQQQKIDSLSSQVIKLNNDLEALRRENAELQNKVSRIINFLRAKEQQASAKQAPQEKAGTKNPTTQIEKKKSAQ